MQSAKDLFSEEASLLYPNKYNERFNKFPEVYSEAPIIRGVVTHLRRWPSDLFYAFLAACCIIASLAFLVFVTVAVCLPTVVDNRMEEISILNIESSANVYFLKLENQTWSTSDFCYIETAARRHSDLNIYLINLLREETTKQQSNSINGNETIGLESKLNDSSVSSHFLIGNQTPEDLLTERLLLDNDNIKRISVSIEKFFNRSRLSTIAKTLNDESLEMAAKAQLLWSVPGVALKPNNYCALDYVKRFLCNTNQDECLPDKFATIEPENDIQATGIPCQAFMGFLMEEISKKDFGNKYTLKDAVEKYCPRFYYCPEIRILDSQPKCSTTDLNCPAILSSSLPPDDLHRGNFVT